MVGQVVGAVAPTVIQSATSDEGLINRLLKIVTIIAILGALIVTAIIIVIAFNIWENVGATFSTFVELSSTGFSTFSPISFIVTGVLSIASGFGYGRG
jgi:CBS domain containing-hemolysin-like protein